MTMKELFLALLSDKTILSVVIGGLFSFLGVVIGWGLNEVSATRRAKPKLITPDHELYTLRSSKHYYQKHGFTLEQFAEQCGDNPGFYFGPQSRGPRSMHREITE